MSKIVFGVSGGIAAYRTCDLISSLVKEDIEVHCVLTENAKRFVTPLTYEAIARRPVFSDAFGPNPFQQALHIALAELADLVVVMPATANILAATAHGFANDLLTSTLLSTKSPILFVPAMNTQMWENPATQANLEILRDRGFYFVDPVHGELTCGTIGIGHIADNKVIFGKIKELLSS